MKIRPGTPPVVILGLLLGAGLQDPGLRAQGEKPVKDFTDADPEKLGPAGPGEGGPADWLRRGGGKNPTDRVRGLMEINGRTIAEQEADMRPGVKSEVGSEKGFLGQDERLLDVLAADNRYVVDEQRRTHQELARHLHLLARIGAGFDDREFLYHGSRFKVTGMNRATPGHPPSAFRDGTTANQEAKVHNLDSGRKVSYSLLVPHLIERYGFYEDKGTLYRVEPRDVVEVLDFLKRKGKR